MLVVTIRKKEAERAPEITYREDRVRQLEQRIEEMRESLEKQEAEEK